MSDLQCPYCGAAQEVNHDDGRGYDELTRHEQTCSECGKTFVFTTQISFDYTPSKADCLNGADHRLEFDELLPRKYSRMACKECDFARPATADELAIAKAEGEKA